MIGHQALRCFVLVAQSLTLRLVLQFPSPARVNRSGTRQSPRRPTLTPIWFVGIMQPPWSRVIHTCMQQAFALPWRSRLVLVHLMGLCLHLDLLILVPAQFPFWHMQLILTVPFNLCQGPCPRHLTPLSACVAARGKIPHPAKVRP